MENWYFFSECSMLNMMVSGRNVLLLLILKGDDE